VVWYGTDSLQHGALYLPTGDGPHPVVVLVHGGCWYSPYASRRNSAALAAALAGEGIAVWNVEYRRYDNPGGGWPGTFTDVAYATDFVRRLAASHPLDTTRVVAAGHSAGGHLALWLLARRQLAATSDLATLGEALPLRGAVSLGGIVDLAEYYPRERDVCGNPAVESLLGDAPANVPERVRDGSPAERLPLGAPHWHVAGAGDPIATEASITAFADAARARGDRVTVVRVPDAGHFEVMAPATAAGRAAIMAIREALGAVR
jgi:acetyl esterase/lipase